MIQPTAQQLYPAQGGGANAVSINIYNPQAYGAPQNQAAAQAPMTYPNSLYAMPQGSIYQPMPQEGYQVPAQFSTIPSAVNYPNPMPIAPMPSAMPPSAMTAPQTDIQPQVQPAQTAETQQVQPQAPQQPEIIDVQQANVPMVNIDELLQGLASPDADAKANAINKIAEYVQSPLETALQVVSDPIMNALANIINEDTTGLEGPNEQQIKIAQKIANKETLTPEENALSEQLSPRDKANKNRIFALYNLAMILKLQREEMNNCIETQKANGETPFEPLALKDLIGYDAIQNVIKNDPRPEVKVGAIEALQFLAEPQDKAEIEALLADSLKSNDEAVKLAAQTAIDALAPQQQPAAQETQAAA